jgi:hypothetical protein
MSDWVRYKSVEEVDWNRVHLAGAPPHASYPAHQWALKKGPRKDAVDTGLVWDGFHKRHVSTSSFYHDYLQPREGDETVEATIKVCLLLMYVLHNHSYTTSDSYLTSSLSL